MDETDMSYLDARQTRNVKTIQPIIEEYTFTIHTFLRYLFGGSLCDLAFAAEIYLHTMFELAYTIYVMGCAHMQHNDLHTNNAWVKYTKTPSRFRNVAYDIGGATKTYAFINVRTRVHVFDFDRSYV